MAGHDLRPHPGRCRAAATRCCLHAGRQPAQPHRSGASRPLSCCGKQPARRALGHRNSDLLQIISQPCTDAWPVCAITRSCCVGASIQRAA